MSGLGSLACSYQKPSDEIVNDGTAKSNSLLLIVTIESIVLLRSLSEKLLTEVFETYSSLHYCGCAMTAYFFFQNVSVAS